MIWLVLAAAGFGAGLINAIAGGGSLLSFPALLLTGMGSVAADATNTLAVWPGTVSSAWAYRKLHRRGAAPHRAAGAPRPSAAWWAPGCCCTPARRPSTASSPG
jgi:uncharacterized membrane protein YfcA